MKPGLNFVVVWILWLAFSPQGAGQQQPVCESSLRLKGGLQERDAFEQLRRVSAIDRGRGLWTINGEVWPFEQAEIHYRAALTIFQELALERGPDSACGYRELLRLLLYNRYHRDQYPLPRAPQAMEDALSWSLLYRDHHPDDPWSWLTRGLVLFLDGKVEESSAQFKRGMTLQEGGADLFLSGLPVDLEDPYLSTSINEAETAVWARAVYADMFYPGWREIDGGEMLSPGRYIVSFGIPQTLEFRIKPYNHPKDGPVPEKLVLVSGSDLVSFEDPWRSSDWYVSRENEIKVGDRFRVEEFEYLDPREQISIFRSSARFREPSGNTVLLNTFGLPFPASTPPGRIVGRLRLATMSLDGEENPVGSTVSEVMHISTSDMSRVDTMLIWSLTQELSLPPVTRKTVAETISDSWYSKETTPLEPLPVSGLAMSDVMVAHSVLEGEYALSRSVIRSGYTITPKARPLLRSDQPTRIYFEVYGLTLDDSSAARCEIQVDVEPASGGGLLRRLFRSRSRGVGVSLNWVTDSPDDGVYLDIDAGALPSGPVTLTVIVRDVVSGEQVSSELAAEVM
jgi:hypothetical protein